MAVFENPSDMNRSQDLFGKNEVGINHPTAPGFIRIRDNGDLEIVAGEGVSILMNVRNKSITLIADSIKFMTKNSGLRWNKVQFNGRAISFNEPTFLASDNTQSASSLYRDVDYFTSDFASLFSSTSLPSVLQELDEIVVDDADGEAVVTEDFEGTDLTGETEVVDSPNTPLTGVILVSPDGSKYRLRVNDDGNLITETI